MKKQSSRAKISSRRKPLQKKKSVFKASFYYYTSILLFLAFLLGLAYHYREGLAYYFSFKTNKTLKEIAEEKRISDIRNFQVLSKNANTTAGIDVSEYQSKIDWSLIENVEQDFPIQFVLIRATAGCDREDSRFKENWDSAKNYNFVCGAYHYYRPNENSLKQAALFMKTVSLKKGDLPPVLDIEHLPKNQPLDSLKVGLKRWLTTIEKHYGVKPIIYTGEKYASDFLHQEFSEYSFWIANYNVFVEKIKPDWLFWQFTEKATITGIKGNVDLNIFNGNYNDLEKLTIQ